MKHGKWICSKRKKNSGGEWKCQNEIVVHTKCAHLGSVSQVHFNPSKSSAEPILFKCSELLLWFYEQAGGSCGRVLQINIYSVFYKSHLSDEQDNAISPDVKMKQRSISGVSCRLFAIWTGQVCMPSRCNIEHHWDILLAFHQVRPISQAARDRSNLQKLLLGCEKQRGMSEGSAHQQLEGSLRDMCKIGSAIFWKMCCWFDTFQVRVLFLRMSIIVDEDKLQVLPSKGKEREGMEEKTDLRGAPSHPLIHSHRSVHTVYRAPVHYSRKYQIKGITKG